MMSFSFPFSGKGSGAWLPRRRMPSFPLPVIVKTIMKSGLWPAGAHGRKRRTSGERLLGSFQCACGEETLNHSYPRGPAGRSRVLHFSRMCLSQGEGSGTKILSS